MSQFSRSSDWLRTFFTPSRTGWQPPGRVSDEVSLVQPYDGGGYPTFPPGAWIATTTPAVGATQTANMVVLDDQTVGRIMCLGFSFIAGVRPSLIGRILGPVANLACPITETKVSAEPVGQVEALQHFCPILPPGHTLEIRWYGGDAATQLILRAVVCEARIGTVFYV